MSYRQGFAVATAASLLTLAGCAGGGGGGSYDPGRTALPAGASCKSIRAELNTLDSKGVRSLVERQGSGGKLSPQQKALADQYNKLLSQYLGARCHN